MQARKSIWPLAYISSGLEIATFLSWLSQENSLTTGLLAITLAVDLYVYPKVYERYKQSKDYIDFIITDDDPIFSDYYKRNEKELREGLQICQRFFSRSIQPSTAEESSENISTLRK